jgi:hypothetical protein
MEKIKLRKGKTFYYVCLAILLLLTVSLIVSLIAFRDFLSHRILPFTLLFLFTLGAMYFDSLERKFKKKRYDKMLEKIEKFDAEQLSLMFKELLKRSGYKIKKSKEKEYKFIFSKGRDKYYFSIGRNRPNLSNFKRDNSVYFYMGFRNDSIKIDSDKLIVLDFNDLKFIVDKVV